MPKRHRFSQKQIAIRLIIVGGLLSIFIFTFFYYNVIRIPGFPEILPAKETVAYIEFPVSMEGLDPLSQHLNEILKVNWEKEIAPWAGEVAAFAFLKTDSSEKLLPFLLIQVREIKETLQFLQNYQNQNKQIREKQIGSVTAFSTPTLNFALMSDIVIISSSVSGLETILRHQSTVSQMLSRDPHFITIRKNIGGAIFSYFKPQEIPHAIYSTLSKLIPKMPNFVFAFPALGISAEKKGENWQGSSFIVFNKVLKREFITAYRAHLLNVIPPDFELFISGQNFSAQLKKIDALGVENASYRNLEVLMSQVMREYLPGIAWEQEIMPLIKAEFALTLNSENVLFITDLNMNGQVSDLLSKMAAIEKIQSAFKKIAARFTPKIKEVILPDASEAAELIPDPTAVKEYYEIFNGVEIKGFLLGKKDGVYHAVNAEKWFISNNLSLLKKAVLRTQERGPNLRDSAAYRTFLQPILKNPELLGIANVFGGVFSFSKRMYEDHMETSFMYRRNGGSLDLARDR